MVVKSIKKKDTNSMKGEYCKPTTRRSEDMENAILEGTQLAVAGEALQSIAVDGLPPTSSSPFL